MKNKNWVAWGILAILSLIWGSSFILIKKGLVVYSAGEVGALRILSAALFLAPLAIRKLKTLSWPQLRLLFGIGLLGSFIPAFLFATGQTRLDSGITGVLNGLTPIWVLIIGAVFYKQKVTRYQVVGLLLAFVGTFVLLTAGSGGDLSSINFYALFIVLATICYGANLNIIKFHLAGINAVVITSVSILLVGPMALIYLLTASEVTTKLNEVPGAWAALGYISLLGVMSTSIALIMFNHLVKLTTPIFTSTVTYFIPIVALAWGLLDGEVLILGQVIGILAIIIGVFVTNRKKAK